MSNKEHIETLQLLIGKCGTDSQVEAIQAAIRALEAEDQHRAEVDQLWRDKEGMQDVIRGRIRALEQAESRYRALVEAAKVVVAECDAADDSGDSRIDTDIVAGCLVKALDALEV